VCLCCHCPGVSVPYTPVPPPILPSSRQPQSRHAHQHISTSQSSQFSDWHYLLASLHPSWQSSYCSTTRASRHRYIALSLQYRVACRPSDPEEGSLQSLRPSKQSSQKRNQKLRRSWYLQCARPGSDQIPAPHQSCLFRCDVRPLFLVSTGLSLLDWYY
jgi:hypothetical protein